SGAEHLHAGKSAQRALQPSGHHQPGAAPRIDSRLSESGADRKRHSAHLRTARRPVHTGGLHPGRRASAAGAGRRLCRSGRHAGRDPLRHHGDLHGH
ncbi:helix-turn-helix domain-containing protein, partial [Dysosmobacter welbionis]